MRRLAAVVAAGVCLCASQVRAQAPDDILADSTPTDAMRAGTEQHRPYWKGSGPTRPFLAANMDLGVFYVRPHLQVGYGKPHYEWFGAEIYQSLAISGGRTYAGVRGAWSILDVRAGARYEFPTDHYYLLPRDRYEREDLEDPRFGRSNYIAGEADINLSIPIPRGSIIGVLTGYALLGIPDDRFVYENALKVVAEPPWLWRARLGYLYHFGWQGTMRLGAAVEVIHLVDRVGAVVRAGPLFSVALTHHLEASAAIMIVAYSPDSLGLVGADLGQIGLRYRWATGDRFPEFP